MAMTDMERLETFEDATSLLDNPDALRRQAEKDGYLYFRGLLDADRLGDLRRQIMTLCAQHGWLASDSDPMEGLANPQVKVVESKDPDWRAFYCELQKIRDFHALALDPAVIEALEVLFGESVLPHSRNICRLVFPHTATHSTPPHQDNFYIGGSEETWTAWFPCGECPATLGGVAVARGTHRTGLLDTVEAVGAGGRGVEVEAGAAWVGGDYACGDVILLHSLTIHQGRDNLSGNRLRLSCDFRYQPRSHPLRADSLEPHMGWLSWDEVYADWDEEDPVRYYWRGWELETL